MVGRIVATLLSLTWPGLGQLYNRQLAKGLLLCLIQSVATTFFVVSRDVPLSVVTFALGPFALWAGWDAYRVAAIRSFYRTFE